MDLNGSHTMGNTAKLAATLSLSILLLTACGKTGDSGSGGYKYPRNFPQECVAVYDRWWVSLDKIEASGRFTQESIEIWKHDFNSYLEAFKNFEVLDFGLESLELQVTPEEHIENCQVYAENLDMWEKVADSVDTMSNEELARSVHGFLRVK